MPGGQFAVIAMGKLGGREMTAGSDLDLVFVFDAPEKIETSDALLETMELLSNPKAVATLRAAKAGRLAYKELDLADENFGL